MRLATTLAVLLVSVLPRLASAQVTVQVEASRPGLTLHEVLVEGPRSRWTGMHYDATRPLCTAPCEAVLTPGAHRFAISEDGDPVRADRLTNLMGPARLELDFDSRGGARAVGWVIFSVAALIGAGVAVAGAFTTLDENADEELGYGLMIGGLSAIAVGGIASLPFIALRDHVEVRATSITARF